MSVAEVRVDHTKSARIGPHETRAESNTSWRAIRVCAHRVARVFNGLVRLCGVTIRPGGPSYLVVGKVFR